METQRLTAQASFVKVTKVPEHKQLKGSSSISEV